MDREIAQRPIGLVAFLATVVMLFTAFTTSYLIRRTSPDWHPVPMPELLWLNTLVLAASSGALEVARRRKSRAWNAFAVILGLTFLAGQALAWKQLAAAGVFWSSNPHASFLYMLTAVHGLHLLGGVAALVVGAGRWYWHFVGAVWLYILVLLWVI